MLPILQKCRFHAYRQVQKRPRFLPNHRIEDKTLRKYFSSSGSDGKQKPLQNTLNPTFKTATQAALLLLGGTISARLVYNTFLVGTDKDRNSVNGIRRDASKATVLLNTEGIETGTIKNKITRDQVNDSLQQVDAEEFSNFCIQQQQILRNTKERSLQEAREKLHEELTLAFDDAASRISLFSSWYFAYRTTWKLLSVGLTSAAKHVVSFRSDPKTLSEKVSEDLQALVVDKYQALVLRPKLTDPKIHHAFVHSIKFAHKDYLESLGELESSVSKFVSKQTTTYRSPPKPSDVIVDVDWKTQIEKVDHIPLTFEKTPEFSVALVGTSAVAGKVIGVAGGSSATKAMVGKLVSPFVSKAVGMTLGGGGAKAAAAAATGAGAAGGAMAGGPVGAAIGAAVGLGIDMTVNAGVALMQKSAFEKDVQESIDATIVEWEENLFPELERIHGIWFDHAISVLDVSTTDPTITTNEQ